jgi:eukaryotic-like serine/threonine-protein kinase
VPCEGGWSTLVHVSRRDPPDDVPGEGVDTLVDGRRTPFGVIEKAPDDKRDAKLVGKMFGPYLVQEILGGGAMGVVYRAAHIDTNRVVALKVLRRKLLDEQTIVDRFVREARLAARLGHPHIGGVFELVQVDDRYALALELVEGESLASLLTMPLPPERVTLLIAQLLRGLEHAHAMGLIHRDLKPDNILVEWRNGRDHARIIDFGIAITREGSPESIERLTGQGQIIGTPQYMSPEQARSEVVDLRSDLYSLGTMMYEMLAGVLPFEAPRPVELLTMKIRTEPPPFAVRAPGLIVDPLLEAFCLKLMARVPDARFATARQALSTLDLIATDRSAAKVSLGIMDVEKAMSIVSLPPPPGSRRGR